jgi:hypothetical protein
MDVFSGGDGASGGGKIPHVFTPNGMKPAGNPAPNLPNLMEPLPIQSDHQRLLVAYSDMPPGKRCRLGPLNPHSKVMESSNQLGHFINALKQSLNTTQTTHIRHSHKPPKVQHMTTTCTTRQDFPTPEEYCSTKGAGKPMRKRPQGLRPTRLNGTRARSTYRLGHVSSIRADARSGA